MDPTLAAALPFAVERPLGAGGFAEVFLVRAGGRAAALKIARAEPHDGADVTGGAYHARGVAFATGSRGAWSPDPSGVLEAEIEVLARVRHPAFVRVLDRGRARVSDRDRSWALLEWIDGPTWRAALSERGRVGLHHVAQMCRALAEASESGDLGTHGDVKPDNLMLDASGAVRILDPASGATELDPHGGVARRLVTDWYDPALSGSDVPAVALVAIEALTGEHPLVRTDAARPRRALGPRLADFVARFGSKMPPLAERLLRMPLPRQVDPSLSRATESLLLACVGLAVEGSTLELAEAPSIGELARRLSDLA